MTEIKIDWHNEAEQEKINTAATRDYSQYDTVENFDEYERNMNSHYTKERRNRIAEGFAFALVSGKFTSDAPTSSFDAALVALGAVRLTDALIAELDK